MLLNKTGLPEDSEIVLCTVTSVQHHAVFVKLNEYEGAGMIHISEVSPGRIRNMRDFVEEGRIIVCKVLNVNRERGQIDLSLRRVSEGQRRAKLAEAKQEQMAEKLVAYAAKKLGMEPQKLFDEVYNKISARYPSLFSYFMDVASGKANLEELPKNISKALAEIIEERLKPEEVETKGVLKLVSYDSDGVEKVRAALGKAATEKAALKYFGAGRYEVSVKAPDYKKAEQIMQKAVDSAISAIKSSGGEGSFSQK